MGGALGTYLTNPDEEPKISHHHAPSSRAKDDATPTAIITSEIRGWRTSMEDKTIVVGTEVAHHAPFVDPCAHNR